MATEPEDAGQDDNGASGWGGSSGSTGTTERNSYFQNWESWNSSSGWGGKNKAGVHIKYKYKLVYRLTHKGVSNQL